MVACSEAGGVIGGGLAILVIATPLLVRHSPS